MDTCKVPSISYADLLQHDTDTGDLAKETLVKSLNDYGACRIRDHGIPQDLIDNCFNKSWEFFDRDLDEKIAETESSGTSSASRFVPFGSEKIRGEAHLDETLEFQYGAYEMEGNWSEPSQKLVEASKDLHDWENTRNVTGTRNSYFAPYYYSFQDDNDNNPLRVPPHIDPTTILMNFQDEHAGLEVADLSNRRGSLSATTVEKSATFVPVHYQRGEFLLLIGHVMRRLVPDVKHSVHRVKRPVGIKGFHLNYWIVPDLDTSCDFGDKKEDVAGYLARVFPAALRNSSLQA
ncbi:uncharacterized protein N7469_002961 [Penicillium citrinum]|uniref:Fe2OG dioxygenase domain-containing protein n=1 Tax=Penicillium citrinum TaxID=5077 RepID=A0A9W9PBE4_PENCI|nr:uncharacterized protein N7469_002961 [Penicillium citrinum]KAJ5241370.1 hypothetical protein N7469_002961 [Penicillium citrinum]